MLAQFGPDHKVRHLSLIDILRDLEQPVLRWLTDHTTMITAQRGQLIYTPGETREGLFLLKAGSIRLYRLTADGKKLILSPVGLQGRRGRWIAMAVTSGSGSRVSGLLR